MTKADKLLAALKMHAPHKVRAYNGDDSRDVAVPTRRKKWAQVISAVDARPWSHCELLDKSGSILAQVDNDTPATALEDLGASFEGTRGQLLLGERIALLCMTSVQKAVSQRDEETKALLGAQRALVDAAMVGVKEMTEVVKSIGEVYREQTVAAEDAALARATAEQAGGGQLKELLDATPLLLQLLPVLQKMLGAGGAPVVTNGVSGH